MADAHRSAKHISEALAELDHAILLDPNLGCAYLMRGNLLEVTHDRVGARAAWTLAAVKCTYPGDVATAKKALADNP